MLVREAAMSRLGKNLSPFKKKIIFCCFFPSFTLFVSVRYVQFYFLKPFLRFLLLLYLPLVFSVDLCVCVCVGVMFYSHLPLCDLWPGELSEQTTVYVCEFMSLFNQPLGDCFKDVVLLLIFFLRVGSWQTLFFSFSSLSYSILPHGSAPFVS